MILYLHKRIERNGDSHVEQKHCYEQTKGLVRQATTFLANSEGVKERAINSQR